MFPSLGTHYDEFFAHGVGAMTWTHDIEGRRQLVFLAPAVGFDGEGMFAGSGMRFHGAKIYCETDGKDWTHPGDVRWWDGNLERPTFAPSIWLHDRKGWHGFIRAGDLHDA